MSAYVLHASGDPKSIASGTPPNPVPNGWACKVITDAEFAGLTSGTHRWDPPTLTVVVDTAKTQAATNQQAIRDQAAQGMATLQAIIDTAPPSFSNIAGGQTAVRALQVQVKDCARILRKLIRLALDDYSGTD